MSYPYRKQEIILAPGHRKLIYLLVLGLGPSQPALSLLIFSYLVAEAEVHQDGKILQLQRLSLVAAAAAAAPSLALECLPAF
jgi:hypothetical protein